MSWLVGDRTALEPHRGRVLVYMGGGDYFTVWCGVRRFRRIWTRAMRRRRFIEVVGLRRYCLNPLQIVMVEGKHATRRKR